METNLRKLVGIFLPGFFFFKDFIQMFHNGLYQLQALHLVCLRSIQHSSRDLTGMWSYILFLSQKSVSIRNALDYIFFIIIVLNVYLLLPPSVSPWLMTCECTCVPLCLRLIVKEVSVCPQPLQDLSSCCLFLSDLTGSVTVKIADEVTWWFEE